MTLTVVYLVGSDGHSVRRVDHLEAVSDAYAVATAKKFARGVAFEIWQSDRLVTRSDASGTIGVLGLFERFSAQKTELSY